MPVIRGSNLSQDVGTRLIEDDMVFVSTEKAKEFGRSVARQGDLIFTCWGTIDQVGLIDHRSTYDEYVVSNKQMKLTPDPSLADSVFLYYLFSSPEMRAKILSQGIGSSVPGFNLGQLRRLRLLLPPLSEQRAIAHILGTLDDKIALNRRMNQTLEVIARALFKSWFVDFDSVRAKAAGRQPEGMDAETAALFPSQFEPSALGDIPQGWSVVEIADIAEVIDCLHAKKPDRQESGKPLLQVWNIRDDGLLDMTDTYWISEDDYRMWISRIEARPGDCVITNVGRVGAAAQLPTGLQAALGRNMTGLRCRHAYPFPTFLIQCLLSSAMANEIALKTDTGTILDALNVRNISKLRLILPETAILARYETLQRPLRARMEHNLRGAATLAVLRDTLLPRLLSGELHVPEAARLVEAADEVQARSLTGAGKWSDSA